MTSFFWFGTILYVHLVLKPKSAAKGLPKGEMLIGIYSMIIMAVTGGILVWFRVTSTDVLLHTRFGILLTIKVALFLTMVLSALFVLVIIAPRLRGRNGQQAKQGDEGFTLEGLSH